jgi:hypothetical protein
MGDMEINYATPNKILDWLSKQQVSVEPVVMHKIAKIVEDLFKLYEQGNFSNGVEYCGMDQGEIHARDYINNLRIDWNKIKAESNFSA